MTGKNHPAEARLRHALARPPHEIEPTSGFAAVAAVFDRNLDLLLIKRAEHPGDPWSGHVAFPGGRVEAEDPGPLHAAMRETVEEVGLPLHSDQLLGRLDDLATLGGRPGMVIRPFVVAIDAVRPPLSPNREVAAVLWRALDVLLVGEGRGTMQHRRQDQSWTLPCVDFDGVRLWGLTLMVIDGLLDRIDGGGIGLARERRAPSDAAR